MQNKDKHERLELSPLVMQLSKTEPKGSVWGEKVHSSTGEHT